MNDKDKPFVIHFHIGIERCDTCDQRRPCLIYVGEEYNHYVCFECLMGLWAEWMEEHTGEP